MARSPMGWACRRCARRRGRQQDRACGQRFPRAGDRDGREYRGGEEGDARGECGYLTVIIEGRYRETYLAQAAAPNVQPAKRRRSGSPGRFRGAQRLHDRSLCARAADNARGYTLPHLPSLPRMASPWLQVGPEVLYWAVRTQRSVGAVKHLHLGERTVRPTSRRWTDGSTTATG